MADSEHSERSLDERLRDVDFIQEALACAVRDAMRRHKQAGNKVAVWRGGGVVWVEADELPG